MGVLRMVVMLVSAIPARLGQEPVDMLAYDRWQDAEGLLDADDAVKAAYGQFRGEWRAARDGELRPVEPRLRLGLLDGLDAYELAGRNMAQRFGGRLGLCIRLRGSPLGQRHMERCRAWRARMIRHDADMWLGMWPVIDGEECALVAARCSREPIGFSKRMRWAWRQLGNELQS